MIFKKLMVKICIFGDKGVGKSTFIRSFPGKERILASKKEKIGVDFYVKEVKIYDQQVYYQIWDFSGEERFRFLFPTYMKGANGGIILYDITNDSSFKSIDNWLMEFRKSTKKSNIPIFLIGNKIDLSEKRAVLSKNASNYAKTHQIDEYIECNANNKKAVEDIFISFSRRLLYYSISKIFEDDLILKIIVNLTVFKELNLTELAKKVNKSKSTLSRYTNRLEELGFIKSFTKENEPERGAIKTKYYALIKDLGYYTKRIDFDSIDLSEVWKDLYAFYQKKSYTFRKINLLSRQLIKLIDGLRSFSPQLLKQPAINFEGENKLDINALSLWIEKIENFPFYFHLLTETQFREAKLLLQDFNSKLEKILEKSDESNRPYLLTNMIFPLLYLINNSEKPLDPFK